MNDLVRELQAEIKRLLLSDVIKNDRYAEKQEINQAIIVETWRTWAEEFFCDTVGFVMSGTSFTSAFSMYLRMLGRSQYHVEKLAHRSHPVPWIRIQLLANRARQMGYNAVAALGYACNFQKGKKGVLNHTKMFPKLTLRKV